MYVQCYLKTRFCSNKSWWITTRFVCNYLTISLGVVSIKLRANASTFKEVQFWNRLEYENKLNTRSGIKHSTFYSIKIHAYSWKLGYTKPVLSELCLSIFGSFLIDLLFSQTKQFWAIYQTSTNLSEIKIWLSFWNLK